MHCFVLLRVTPFILMVVGYLHVEELYALFRTSEGNTVYTYGRRFPTL